MGTRPAPAGPAYQPPPAGLGPARPPTSQRPTGVLQGWRPGFVLLARLDRLEVSGGLVLPDLARADAVAGRGGNTSADTVDPAGWVASLERQGYRRVPDDLDFECWGARRAGCASGCTYRDWYETDRVAGRWSEAWTRPKVLGATIKWPVDWDGKRAFQAQVLKWLLNGSELDNDLVEAACAPAIEIARAYLGNVGNHEAARRLKHLVAQLPPEHIPSDLAPYAPTKD